MLANEVFKKTSEFLAVFAGDESRVGREAVERRAHIFTKTVLDCKFMKKQPTSNNNRKLRLLELLRVSHPSSLR